MLEKEEQQEHKTVRSSELVPRSWFIGGTVLVALLSLIQVVLSSVLLGEYNHDHDEVVAALEPFTGYSFEDSKQQWASGPLGQRPPGFEGQSWQDVLAMARGSTVTFAGEEEYMGTNYIPFLKQKLQERYGITLNFIDSSAFNAVNRASQQGDIDFIWLNKDNYFLLKNHLGPDLKPAPLTWGPYANLLPNAVLFDFTDPVISTDYGVPTNGEEMPLHIANFVMVYDTNNMPNPLPASWPPKNMNELMTQVNNGEIKFHPIDPSNWLGTPFLEQIFYANTEPALRNKYRERFDPVFWNDMKAIVFPKLKKFHEKLYVKDDRKYSKPPVVRELFKAGEIHLSSEYAPGAVYNRIRSGAYPEGSRAFIFEGEKMVSNTNFLTIVGNGPNKAAAMVAINLASSLEHQYKRFIPNTGSWNGLQAFSPFKKVVTDGGWNTVFDEIETFEGAPPLELLAANRIGEFNKEYLDRMRDDFKLEIGIEVELAN